MNPSPLEDLPRCNGKVCYPKRTAEEKRNQRHKQGARALRIYHCPDCNHWHLTHSQAKR